MSAFKTIILHNSEIDYPQWDSFIALSPQYCAYALSWYLDITSPNWVAIIIYNDKEWLSVFPIQINAKFGISYSFQPIFTQYLGIFFLHFADTNNKMLSFQKEIIEANIRAIPSEIKVFSYNFSPNFQYFLPFHSHFFDVTPRLTYILPLNITFEELYNNYSSKIQDSIAKAQKLNFKVQKEDNIDLSVHFLIKNNIISNQQAAIAHQLWSKIKEKEKGFCLSIKNEKQEIICSAMFLRDKDKLIFLLLATERAYKSKGVTALLIHAAIKEAIAMKGILFFDFEGSMLEGVENYFRGFNPTPVYYYNIKKNHFPILYEIYKKIK